MNYKRLLKNSKAISPIFATLILIAIAVIAGVVVYMFTSGTLATMTAGGTAGQEKVTIQAASSSTTTVSVYLEQTGGPQATINGLIIKDSSGNVLYSATTLKLDGSAASLAIPSGGALHTLTGVVGATLAGATVTATVTTAAGGSFVSTAFVGQ